MKSATCSLTITLIAAFLAVSGSACAQDLWRGARFGMTIAQVRRLFPAATAADSLTPNAGDSDLLQVGAGRMQDRPVLAHFLFDRGQLASVQLRFQGVMAGASSANLGFAQRLAGQLSREYGRGYDCGSRNFADVDEYECKWSSAAVLVRLFYLDAAGQAPVLYIAFHRADDTDADL